MPELPEVETIRAGVHRHAEGRRITLALGGDNRLMRHNAAGFASLSQFLPGSVVAGVHRRGKNMWLTFEGSNEALVIHLGMSGQVHVARRDSEGGGPSPLGRHEHMRLHLEDGTELSFVDARTFGHITLSPLAQGALGRMVPAHILKVSPDPLELEDFEPTVERVIRTSRPIKTVLLDQHVISGIGNIYADEALYRAGLYGGSPASAGSKQQIHDLLVASKTVMQEAILAGGTSFDQFYVDVEGDPGYFERSLNVYGLEGEPCVACGRAIRKITIQGRSHFYCRTCQH